MNNNDTKSAKEIFLSTIQKINSTVSIYLSNGVKLKGMISNFDDAVILLDSGGKTQLIYQHSISSIMPDNESNSTNGRK